MHVSTYLHTYSMVLLCLSGNNFSQNAADMDGVFDGV